MRVIRAASIAMFLFLCGINLTLTAQAAAAGGKPGAPKPPDVYCTTTGGEVETRTPVYGTNGPIQDWLPLAGTQGFCQYTLASDGSRIHVSLETLDTTMPTLAALAYYAETAWNGQGEGNPASLYCTQLGGSDLFGGINWVVFNTTDIVLEACIFPDHSTIDSWGLFYHSANIIRGIDLSTVLKYANPYPLKKGTQ